MSLSSGTITITLGTVSDGTKVGSDTGNNKVKWTPSNAATDLAGNAASTAFKQSGNVEQF
ncbi:MAG TPA: hypothetical protein VJ622_14155, partial [Acidimicrobiia bacterium]|nr:hypothetical protein [Acidimicrobiia bacterium]